MYKKLIAGINWVFCRSTPTPELVINSQPPHTPFFSHVHGVLAKYRWDEKEYDVDQQRYPNQRQGLQLPEPFQVMHVRVNQGNIDDALDGFDGSRIPQGMGFVGSADYIEKIRALLYDRVRFAQETCAPESLEYEIGIATVNGDRSGGRIVVRAQANAKLASYVPEQNLKIPA